jgi:imidazole glycerol-phosphate synthase subunit HisH
MIAIINYGSGNIAAIANIYKQLKIPHVITGDPKELVQADRFILPGVGAFDTTMRYLRDSGILSALNEEVIGRGKKVMGVCVGMQILAESSEEGELAGLCWIPGRVRRIDLSDRTAPPMLPHMGWNSIRPARPEAIFEGVDNVRGFYFLHSYYFDAAKSSDVLATADYGGSIPCAVHKENIYGMQFHPEKSHANGVAIFRNFAAI